eukprot:TRINITY_DN2502_c0_g1_i3.p1 TRINITY_DN2502_c0_g1~~TRINITY_DN2502_c0_g1_i3.p1  ORF type:complete len:205 (+),score=48.20 TRINITY_DN2502_c0_g1_i3:132-746(+)
MEAFKESVFPDKLEGDNRYYCHTCQKKCDALKGSNWIRLPYILTLHLKRFDFDYMTMEKKKLTNKLTFPEILNLNPFLSDSNQPIESFIEAGEELKDRQEVINNARKAGPYVYELFSIILHVGQSGGGHQYAYIRSFRSGSWYEFNDCLVKEVPLCQLKEAFGGERRGQGCAFILMYRQYDPRRNIPEPTIQPYSNKDFTNLSK